MEHVIEPQAVVIRRVTQRRRFRTVTMLICDVTTPYVCPSCHRAFSHWWMLPVRSEAYEKQRVCGASISAPAAQPNAINSASVRPAASPLPQLEPTPAIAQLAAASAPIALRSPRHRMTMSSKSGDNHAPPRTKPEAGGKIMADERPRLAASEIEEELLAELQKLPTLHDTQSE